MDFRKLFLAVLLGIVASFWMTVPTAAAHAGTAADLAPNSTAATASNAAKAATVCVAVSLGDAVEAGGAFAGETDEFGHEPFLPAVEAARPAAAPEQVALPYRTISLPVPHRPPARA